MFVAACMVFVATKTSVFGCGQNWFKHCLYLWRVYLLSLCIRHSVDEQQSSNEQNTGKTGKQKLSQKLEFLKRKCFPSVQAYSCVHT